MFVRMYTKPLRNLSLTQERSSVYTYSYALWNVYAYYRLSDISYVVYVRVNGIVYFLIRSLTVIFL